MKNLENFAPYTDQEPFPVPIAKIIDQYDVSEAYGLDAEAIFKTTKGKYIGVVVSGCS